MADSYLIDGYNLIHALGLLDRRAGSAALERARRRLLDQLVNWFGDDAPCVTVIFDAGKSPRHIPPQQTHHGLHVVFARGEASADDLIETLIAGEASPKSLVVISNDTRLQQAARRRAAQAWTHSDLLDYIERRAKPAAAEAAEETRDQPLSPDEVKRWLKEFGP